MGVLETNALVERLGLLGLRCEAVSTDRLSSATAALACFPMYMVANVHAWTKETQFHVPVLDLPGIEEMLESLELGRQEGALPVKLESPHRAVLSTLLKGAKAPDRIFYEYALETLQLFLNAASPTVAAQTRTLIARSIVKVAEAAGKGIFSSQKVSPEERVCIEHIVTTLRLDEAPEAVEALKTLD